MKFSWHFIWILLLGYLIGYYWRTPGNVSVGKLMGGSAA